MSVERGFRRVVSVGVVAVVLSTQTARAIFVEQPGPFPREGECNVDDAYFDAVRHRIGVDRNIGPGTLKGAPVPEPSNLGQFVRDRGKAVVLGKALFWDMQVGSDGVQACATCHFRAGADPRSRNQAAPGGQDNPEAGFDLPPNTQLQSSSFPLHLFADPGDRTSAVLRSIDDVVSSQGTPSRDFVDAPRGAVRDVGTPRPDAVFHVGGAPTRRVEPRNTPTVINAVFNHRNFWDGRADALFNGVNPFGSRDPNARVLRAIGSSGLQWTTVRIDNASLASQAVGPPLSDKEMGFFGRPLRDVGRRLASARPLRQQRVHAYDSVLGPHVAGGGKGLATDYATLVREAFHERWWKSQSMVVVNETTGAASFAPLPSRPLRRNEYTLLEWNFSLFLGLAIQMYEATLVSDDARIDRHFDSLAAGGSGVLNATERQGMALFDAAGCADCHSGAEFTSASVRTLVTGFDNPDENPTFQPPELIERMTIGSCDVAIYDQGFYNIGVRPTDEDLGLGALDPFGNPLSIAKLLTLPPAAVPSQELLTIPYPSLMALGRIPPIEVGERTAVEGTFKIPGLRNVALTAPYFHNGGVATLRGVVEFYNRGGDFHDHVSAAGVPQDRFMALGIGRLELSSSEIDAIVRFLLTLTDPRVVQQAAPFDHPELFVPDGHVGDAHAVEVTDAGEAVSRIVRIPEVGAYGGPLPRGFLE
jgi:cytochrome c peroxidase